MDAPHRSRAAINRQKRLLVLGRLAEPDADRLSDRAIARELNVSQPFVGRVRRPAGPVRSAPTQPAAPIPASVARRWIGRPHVEGPLGRGTGDEDVLGVDDGDCDASGMPWSGADPAIGAGRGRRLGAAPQTGAQAALDRVLDTLPGIGPCRRVSWPVIEDDETSRARIVFDPFE